MLSLTPRRAVLRAHGSPVVPTAGSAALSPVEGRRTPDGTGMQK